MKIQIVPKIILFAGDNSWYPKMQSVIFVQSEEDAEILFKLLCEQDEYWESYRNLIKVIPTDFQIENERDLDKYCKYCGKTDIYDVEELRQKFDRFIIYQYQEEC